MGMGEFHPNGIIVIKACKMEVEPNSVSYNLIFNSIPDRMDPLSIHDALSNPSHHHPTAGVQEDRRTLVASLKIR